MDNLVVKEFVGLDLRRLPEATSPRALLEAKNIHVSRGQGMAARGPFRRVAVVDAASKGLYVVNDTMRCALAYPVGVPVPRPPIDITYDLLSDTGGFSDTLAEVTDVTTWDARAYLCVGVPAPSGGRRYRHYYPPAVQSVYSGFATLPTATTVTIAGASALVTAGSTVWFFGHVGAYLVTLRVGDVFTFASLPALSATTAVTCWSPVTNRVMLPFEPGPAVEATAGKVWAPNRLTRTIQFSSTQFGPTDWVAVNDAGFLPTTQYPGGDEGSQALAVFNKQLVIFYPASIQVWDVDPDPTNHSFFGLVGGAGTLAPNSVANINGDLLYLSGGVFSSLSAVITTGQPKAGSAYGEAVEVLTRALARDSTVVAVWSSARQQYLCASGNQVFVFTFAPNDGDKTAVGWGRWEAPWPISHIVEWRGNVYVRRSDQPEIWVLEADGTASGPDETVAWSWASGFADFEAGGYGKAIRALDLHARGTFTLAVQSDPTPNADAPIDLGAIDAASKLGGVGKMLVVLTADMLQLRASGTGPMAIDGYTWRFKKGGLL